MVNPWQGRRVFLAGHTGFKGGWLAVWLAAKGALIRGYALAPATDEGADMALETNAQIAAYERLDH
jgi:nucleoside-diphosphate-sugar epimerase